ncbi:DUF1176 domain-containing protein [Pseudoduganella buxea]|nr:DUF1176 domain-containing protein [Pseudoduganella buxea]GGB91370.1 hypothetical protein GCM10011572_11790 [Pseudoduganella buxea]
MKRLLATLAVLCAAGHAAAGTDGVTFSHLDWDLVCDNTRTCRAVGYNAIDDAGPPVSLLLTRAAGPHQAFQAVLRIDDAHGERPGESAGTAMLTIGGSAAGQAPLNGHLSAAQVAMLVAALPGHDGKLTLSHATGTWTVSDAGASAVLLKIDEIQGRLGTPGAAVRKGTRPEKTVPAARSAPVVRAHPLPAPLTLPVATKLAMAAALRATPAGQDCEGLLLPAGPELRVGRLDAARLLVSSICFSARETVMAFWTVNRQAPYAPKLVAEDVTEVRDNTLRSIHAMHDCSSGEARMWDGREIVLARVFTAGNCVGRRFMHGAWQLPTFVTDVRLAGARP